MYPGYGRTVGGWEGYTGTHPAMPPRVPYCTNLALRSYPRPNEGKLRYFNEVSQIWSRKGPERVPEWPRYDPPDDPPDDLPDGLQMTLRSPYPRPQGPMPQNRPYLAVY